MPIKKTINKNFFKEWSPDMAYVLGFMFADGNIIISKRNTHFFSIYTNDKVLLYKMIKIMESNHKLAIRIKNGKCNYRVQIGSKDIFEDLVKLGLTPNKARRMRLPKIPPKYIKSFILGYFDGDGHVWSDFIHKGRNVESLTIQSAFTSASIDFLNALHVVLKSQGIKKGYITIGKLGTYGRLVLSCHDSLKLYEIMYNSRSSLYLLRKKRIFEKYMSLRL